ncbi:hypothetical protein PF005_g5069 [Phytophthora fragariae]|uniref:Uncharacterized protein n=1 Tax=Phytophthora fragariae TaxID=53985 RepID=A0A6A3Z0S5_9STRA|nr:hypothetical protein PF005_g5069 [Phytophthora fragariae]
MGSHVHVLLLLVVQAAATWTGVAATMYQIRAWYSGITCDGTPYDVFISESSTCSTNVSCSTDDTTGASHVASLSTVCTTDYMAAAKELFGDSPYLLLESYTGLDCKTFGYAEGFFASGNCEGSSGFSAFSIAIIDNNGSASVRSYNASMCPDSSFLYSLEADADALSSHSCVDYFYKWFSTNDVTSVASSGSTIDVNTVTSAPTSSPTPTPTPSPSPTLSTAAIIGIGTGVFVVIVVVGS